MKSLKFSITVEGLPDHAKDYRVQNDILSASFRQLKQKYPDGEIHVRVGGPEVMEPRPDLMGAA